MPPRRWNPNPRTKVRLNVDGQEVVGHAGESVATTLAAAGKLVLSRSVKYHRPRGAHCFSGRCDGCLMRVDGVGNVMTCRTPSREGMTIETQNVVGSAENDLLSVTDWFFPSGLDHHGMFTFSRPINALMQSVARRIAGVGTLPDQPLEQAGAQKIDTDVLVIGAGPAGLMTAARCARNGLRVEVFEDEDAPGGYLRWLPGLIADERGPRVPARAIAERLIAQAVRAGASIHVERPVVGIFDESRGDRVALAQSKERAIVVSAKKIVVATGIAEVAPMIAGADAPGVFNARGAGELLSQGVVPGECVALVGEGPVLEAIRETLVAADTTVRGPFTETSVAQIESRGTVRGIVVREAGTAVSHACDAVIVASRPSSVYELAAQGGAAVRWEEGAFVVTAADDGATAHQHLRAVGGMTGRADLATLAEQARRAADAIAEELA